MTTKHISQLKRLSIGIALGTAI
ncbi:MAG: hypothetical protein JWQ87_2669, partial [Candidatus Sulfotelmatobacter sp.]|nr:hypothetical protein [Candidatus Sulfotelmatobacter sp.]